MEVRISDGSGTGDVAFTDATGLYRVNVPSAAFGYTLEFYPSSLSGYSYQSTRVTVAGSDVTLNIALTR